MGHAIAATPSDAELLEASRRGEVRAFGELVDRYQHVVSAVSYARTRDRALGEDVAQETFLAAWRQLDQVREPGRIGAWLCGIARNLARKAGRHHAREVAIDDLTTVPADARDNPFDHVSAAQAERVVGEALARVPEKYRDVLVLYYQEQRPIRDVAAMLGITEAAAMQRLSRGRQQLAAGVHSLVERSLRRRPRRNLVAGVLAALPASSVIAPSRAHATPNTHGGFMLKLIAAAALVAAGTTSLVVVHHLSSRPEVVADLAAVPAAIAAPTAPDRIVPAPVPAPPPRLAPPRTPSLPAPSVATAAPTVPEPSVDRATIDRWKLRRGPSRGPADAPVTIVMFTDLQCPYCARSLGTLDKLFEEYPDQLRLVVKQMPVHETAKLAAEAALAADAQGKFWELDRLMVEHPKDLSKEGILALAADAGLDVSALRAALDSHAFADAVTEDRAAADALEFTGTPSFLINGRPVRGALPIEALRPVIDASLRD